MRRLADNVLAWLEGKGLEEFHAIEFTFTKGHAEGTHVLFPDKMPLRRSAKGEVVEQEVLIRPPTADDELAARFDAIAHANRLFQKHGAKGREILTLQEAKDAIGEAQFGHLETHGVVARCIHEVAEPHQQWKRLELLRRDHLPEAIITMFRRMNTLRTMLDPCLEDMTEDQFWGAVAYIGEHQNISPLAAMPGGMEYVFLVRLCVELRQRMASFSSTSTETSTPGSSDPPT